MTEAQDPSRSTYDPLNSAKLEEKEALNAIEIRTRTFVQLILHAAKAGDLAEVVRWSTQLAADLTLARSMAASINAELMYLKDRIKAQCEHRKTRLEIAAQLAAGYIAHHGHASFFTDFVDCAEQLMSTNACTQISDADGEATTGVTRMTLASANFNKSGTGL